MCTDVCAPHKYTHAAGRCSRKHERAENIHVYFGVAYEIASLCFFLQRSISRVEQAEKQTGV
jgi:hypothetical protein